MSESLIDVLTSVVALMIGFGLGQIVAWRTAKVGGRAFLVPTAHPGPKTQKIAAVIVIVVAIASMISGVVTQARVEECNQQYRELVKVRSAGTAAQFKAITDLQTSLAEIPAGEDGEEARLDARKAYVARVHELEKFRAANPYPDAEC